ncbi:hypothetical protein JD276_03250 [Leucobacter sp. CSA1]|uniref:Uncharacterized protein n=1 Tax=Leucobacter chromiisoli TaxID=2796471 RepID=A0A934Q5M2_9MICO|nr:hypothetical protein [Leucobacter chromiisoli]MBK0418046.1 hypothetical protein [Leucobacter chromiisoli]
MGGKARRVANRILGCAVLLALLVVGGLAFTHRQAISDHFKAQGFEASEEVSSLVDRLDLTDAGRRIFLASHPTLDASQGFNEQCAKVDHSEQGHVLGCYSGSAIHLFAVTDERLDGIVEVTAAHELLHAAYERLGAGERDALSRQLLDAYESLAEEDPELARRMEVYEHLSDAAFANELHSVLGTEVRKLPPRLEEHYRQWFGSRELIVDFFDAYHGVFSELQTRAESLQAELTALREDVERRSAEYDAAVERFNADAAEFQRRNEALEFSDEPEEFDRIYADLDQRRAQLEATLAGLQADIARYETLRTELQQLNQTSNELDQHLNSDLAPPSTRPG